MDIPVDDEENKILKFPVRQKVKSDKFLKAVTVGKCMHMSGFTIDETLEHVTCNACSEKLNPMWVLRQLAQRETRWHHASERYQDEMKRLKERSRTKCQHCGKITPISKN